MSLLRSILEAEKFLDNKIFLNRLVHLNEKFDSDIARSIANSDIFKSFPEHQYSSIGGRYDSKISKSTLEKWLDSIGKRYPKSSWYSFERFFSQSLLIGLDTLTDEDFERIDKSDVRRKKYANYLIFWFNEDDQLVAVSKGTNVMLAAVKRHVWTGETSGNLEEIEVQDNIDIWELWTKSLKDKDGNPIELKHANKLRVENYYPKTLDLQRNNYITTCYGLSQETLDKIDISAKRRERQENSPYKFRKSEEELKQEAKERLAKKKSELISKRDKDDYFKNVQKRYTDYAKDSLSKELDKVKNEIKDWRTKYQDPNYKFAGWNSSYITNRIKAFYNAFNNYLDAIRSYKRLLEDETYSGYKKSDIEEFQKELNARKSNIDFYMKQMEESFS